MLSKLAQSGWLNKLTMSNDFKFVVRVIRSCKTLEQLGNAGNLIDLLIKKHNIILNSPYGWALTAELVYQNRKINDTNN